jgi:hypothetical protein
MRRYTGGLLYVLRLEYVYETLYMLGESDQYDRDLAKNH